MEIINSINSNVAGNNTFLGPESGKHRTTGIENVAMGFDSLTAITSGSNNAALGNITGTALTTGSQNTIIGSGSGAFLQTGTNNIILGYLSGSNLTTNESDNIIIANSYSGTNGDTGKIVIGVGGVQTTCTIAGITGVTPSVAGAKVMLMDTAGQAGTTAAATDGQVLIGSTGANPAWASLTAGSGISVTPGAGSISIAATGGSISFTSASGAVNMTPNSGYYVTIANVGATFTLPVTSKSGDVIIIFLEGDNSFTNPQSLSVAQNAGQSIFYGGEVSTTGATGGINSSGGNCYGGSIVFQCLINNTTWCVQTIAGMNGVIVF